MAGEGFLRRSNGGSDGASTPPTALLDFLHFHFPWVLLLLFMVAFVANSVASAESSADTAGPVVTGPGGKPLPRPTKKREEEQERLRRKRLDFSPLRKLVFYYLSAGVILTFVANATNIVIHALTKRADGWWCGEPTAVSGSCISSRPYMRANSLADLYLCVCLLLQPVPDLARGHHSISKRCPLHHVGCCAPR
jgi:hypothetical protein